MSTRIIAALLAFSVSTAPMLARAQTAQGSITGRILDTSQGLPVPAATVELDQGNKAVSTTSTDATGSFRFANVTPGEYSLLVTASGYISTRVSDVSVAYGAITQVQTAIQPAPRGNLKEITRVAVGSRAALQTSATINQYVDPSQVQLFGQTRIADTLAKLPGVQVSTSSSVGDDASVSIRGFNSSETATLLDGHPIGPLGAGSGAFNFKLSPFYGLSGTQVIYGSGAAGIYGTSTIAGAVDFQTLNPTRMPETTVEQGVGNNDHSLTGFTATGTLNRLGYAFAGANEYTEGQFPPGNVTQTGLLGASAVYSDPNTNPPNGYSPPDFTAANVNNIANTYGMSGGYALHNWLGKLTYQLSPKASLLASAYAIDTWNDKTGEGDNDYFTYDYQLYNAPTGNNFFTPSGVQTNCSSSQVAALADTPSGFECLTPQQYAAATTGPAGGGIGRFNDSHMQDYHARYTQQLGSTTFVVDGFVNNYFSDEHKAVGGPVFDDKYLTHGLLISDEFSIGSQHDVSFGFFTQHQSHHSTTNYLGNPTIDNGTFGLTSSSYFVRDVWTPTLKFTTLADVWVQRSVDTATTNVDPRISFVFRPNASDVFRLTGGRAYSEPDPFTVLATNAQFGAPQSLNPVCSAGALNSVANVANPNLKTETATDIEFAYGHRFNARTTVQVDAYSTNEQNPILSGDVPLSAYPQYQAGLQTPYTEPNGNTVTLQQGFLDRIAGQCGGSPTSAVLGFRNPVNAGTAQYRGIDLTGDIGLIRNLGFSMAAGYESAQFTGIPVTVLENNHTLINGVQFAGVPQYKGTASLNYGNAAGTRAIFEGNYVGTNNSLNRNAYWWANLGISKTTGPVTVSFGEENIFNSNAQQWGFIGWGVFQPENQFGHDHNALDQATERFGLPYRQLFLTASIKV